MYFGFEYEVIGKYVYLYSNLVGVRNKPPDNIFIKIMISDGTVYI